MERVTVLYDEDCGFCRWSADRLRSWDRRRALRFVPIQSAEGKGLLAAVSAGERLDSMHAVSENGHVRSAGAALPPILRALPGGAPLASISAGAPAFTEAVYRSVARRRERLGSLLGTEACRVDPSRAAR